MIVWGCSGGQSTLHLQPSSTPVSHPWALACSGLPGPLAGSFFLKRVLFYLVGLGMTRARSQLAPAMSMQEAVDAIDMHFMLHFGFKCLVNLLHRGNLSPFGSREKGLQKGLFLLDRQIVVMASAFG